MTRASMTVKPLTRALGAEISGIDLTETPDQATLDAIYDALIEHLVIFFRDQPMEPEAHLTFARSFGEPEPPHPVYPHAPGFENVMVLANDADNPPDTNDWHTDVTFRQNPPFASILCAKEVPETGGDTLWASMYAAYDALPDEMKTYLEDKTAIHDFGDFRNDFIKQEGGIQALNTALARVGSALHPVVQRHPVTGRPFLFVNRPFTVQVVDLNSRESDRLLEYLFDHIDRPEFQVRFRWEPDSVAMWDNRVTQHYAVADYMPDRRRMHRVTVVDDRRIARSNAA